jgi:hypothetical protein
VLSARYELTHAIASGGMAQVWRAQDKILDRPVAIKILHAHLATDAAFVARFRREAVASARLSHSSIVAVYDTVSDNGIEAIVMELIDGRTLRTILDHSQILPPSTVVQIGMQIADALGEAHRAGIVHRDIKPANIMIDNEMRVVVTDFGIAKATKDADLTSTGTLLGTAKYLAPEQVTGEPVDPRTDLYSLGVVLFEALAGEPPFKADTDAATALARIQGPVPRCRQRRADVPVDLDDIVARAMAREPDDRFERASKMRTALADANLARPPGDAPVTPGDTAVPPPPPAASTRNQVDNRPPATVPPPASTGQSGAVPASAAPVAAAAGPADPPVAVDGTAIMTPAMIQAAPTAEPGTNDEVVKGRRGRRKNKAGDGKRRWVGRTFYALLIVAGFITAGLLVLGGALGSGDDGGSDQAIPIARATSADPQGDRKEREDRVERAVDQDLRTAWWTETYRSPNFAGLKDGVGLVMFFESRQQVQEVTIVTSTENWSAEFYLLDGELPDFSSWSQAELRAFSPTSIGERIGDVSDASGDTTIDLDNGPGTGVLLWVTDHGTTVDNDGDVRNRFAVTEAIFNARSLPEE